MGNVFSGGGGPFLYSGILINDGKDADFHFTIEGTTDNGLLVVDAPLDRVGIGTASPTEKLHVNGNARATAHTTTSDSRLKEDKKLLTNALEKIKQLNGYNFIWNAKAGSRVGEADTGVIAQEVQKVFPNLVHGGTNEDTDQYLSVNYGGLTAPLISAVKELDAKNTTLENRVKTLEKELAEIKALLKDKK